MNRYRRFLLDMHIPDWDPSFLINYNPEYIVSLFRKAGITSVMLYCQSHTGLTYWPSTEGQSHGAMNGRDFVGEMIECLKKEDIEVFSYYSLTFNNYAFLKYPEWRLVPNAEIKGSAFSGKRYGLVCPNNKEYRDFALRQSQEMIRSYDFDGAFFDMTFWPAVCLCSSCRSRYREETGFEIPEAVDWFSEKWCLFQTARERWLTEYAQEFTEAVKSMKHDIPVYHNFAVGLFNWTRGVPFGITEQNSFLGGDFYGGSLEQHLTSRLMTNLSGNTPVEFMTSTCTHLTDHVSLKSFQEMEIQALASIAFSAAFRFIDGIDPDGRVNPLVYERIGKIYDELSVFEAFLGGKPVEEIAVYVSDNSKMSFSENGRLLTDPSLRFGSMPHIEAVKGAVRVLQEAQLPFGVISEKQLQDLSAYKVVILPNVLRMKKKEVAAFRDYVNRGGALYASRYTSLTEVSGERHEDFMMQDLFGCHYKAEQKSSTCYLKPVVGELKKAISPQNYILQPNVKNDVPGLFCIETAENADVLAILNLPYGAPHKGTVFDHNWASIHSSPPWTDTEEAVIVGNDYGNGKVVYSTADIESVNSDAHSSMFRSIIYRLLGKAPVYQAEAHPSVWLTVFHQKEKNRYIVSFLNYQKQLPVITLPDISFRIFVGKSSKRIKVFKLPEREHVPFSIDEDGYLHLKTGELELLLMLSIEGLINEPLAKLG